MSLNRPSGSMYPWAFTWNPFSGECTHECIYCYVSQAIAPRLLKFGNDKYYGSPKLIESELKCSLKKPLDDGKVIFVESCGDIGQECLSFDDVVAVIKHCCEYPENTYLFQSKNPMRFTDFLDILPPKVILGTTIESNRDYKCSKAPSVRERARAMILFSKAKETLDYKTMISIEPILDFDLDKFVSMIVDINPDFVSIGADSKKIVSSIGLSEPGEDKIRSLIFELQRFTEVRIKNNLSRLMEVE